MIKVLVADNHPIVRIGLETALNNNGITEVIGSVSTTTELFNALSTKNPDVILLEMDIPEVEMEYIENMMNDDYSEYGY